MKYFFLFLLLLTILLIPACQNSQNETIIPDDTSNENIWIVPEPDLDTGIIHGSIQTAAGQPITDGVFLAHNLSYDNPQLPPTISFSFQNSPRGKTNQATGDFYFQNVVPAENYVIVILTGPGEIYSIKEEGRENPLTISLSAGDKIDLGLLKTDLP